MDSNFTLSYGKLKKFNLIFWDLLAVFSFLAIIVGFIFQSPTTITLIFLAMFITYLFFSSTTFSYYEILVENEKITFKRMFLKNIEIHVNEIEEIGYKTDRIIIKTQNQKIKGSGRLWGFSEFIELVKKHNPSVKTNI